MPGSGWPPENSAFTADASSVNTAHKLCLIYVRSEHQGLSRACKRRPSWWMPGSGWNHSWCIFTEHCSARPLTLHPGFAWDKGGHKNLNLMFNVMFYDLMFFIWANSGAGAVVVHMSKEKCGKVFRYISHFILWIHVSFFYIAYSL